MIITKLHKIDLNQIMKDKGIKTLKELSNLSGIDYKRLIRLRNENVVCSIKNRKLIERALNIKSIISQESGGNNT